MSVYDEITQAILAELEKGVPPWVKSWSSHLPMNVVSQKEYRGINICNGPILSAPWTDNIRLVGPN
jgi:antirestriction protein ArdC